MTRRILLFLGFTGLLVAARGQGAFGDSNFRADVERVSREIGHIARGGGERDSGERESSRGGSSGASGGNSSSSSSRDYEAERRRALIAAAEAEARAERERERERKAQEAELKKKRERAVALAAKNVKKAEQSYSRTGPKWDKLFSGSRALELRWKYATELLDVVQRDGALLVWGLDGKVDQRLRTTEREFRARLDALRAKMNAYALLFEGLESPLHIDAASFLEFEPFSRSRLAEMYLNDLQRSLDGIDRASPKIGQAQAALDKESGDLITAARAFQKLVEEARASSRPWLVHQWQQISTQVAAEDPWRGDVLAAMRELREPPPLNRPEHLTDLKPGDVVLLGPGGAESKLAYIAGIFLAGRELSDNPAAHALTFIGRDAAGRALFLDHVAFRGSHIKGEVEFNQEYGARHKFVARPQSVVNGRVLLDTAIGAARATTLNGSDFGLIGDDTVCSEKAAIAVGKATGQNLIRKRLSSIDVHPSDFFDDKRLGWYFVVNPMKD